VQPVEPDLAAAARLRRLLLLLQLASPALPVGGGEVVDLHAEIHVLAHRHVRV
jgi:hypothetical protein